MRRCVRSRAAAYSQLRGAAYSNDKLCTVTRRCVQSRGAAYSHEALRSHEPSCTSMRYASTPTANSAVET